MNEDLLINILQEELNLAFWKKKYGNKTPNGCRYIPYAPLVINLTDEEQNWIAKELGLARFRLKERK